MTWTQEQLEDTARFLEGIYGSDPSEVGAIDGTEDDFGDLIGDCVTSLTGGDDELDDATFERVQDAAQDTPLTMIEFVRQLAAALDG